VPSYIGAVIDKSVLQSLSAREAKWLFHHFRVNVPPVLFSEVLGDLAKTKALATGTAEGDVRMLASKITSHSVFLNEAHYNLIASELQGHRVDMDGRPIVSNAKVARMPDGSSGIYVDQTPFQAVMDRWRAGDFDGMEREFGRLWRADQASINLEALIKDTKHLRVDGLTSLPAVVELVQAVLFRSGRDYAHLDNLMQMAGAEPSSRAAALRRWNRSGRPPPMTFVPYTAFVARLEAIFMFGLHAGVVTTRATNRIDIDYFKYLPFTEVFSSSDRLHVDLFPVFARRDQNFVVGRDLKAALQEMVDYYDRLSEDDKRHGSMTYADYPPVNMDNSITRLFDDRFPDWRQGANIPRPPRDTSGDAELLAKIKSRFEWAKRHAK
jgi:hypothetical protein